jgi:uncharacterized membrane protein YGL010W
MPLFDLKKNLVFVRTASLPPTTARTNPTATVRRVPPQPNKRRNPHSMRSHPTSHRLHTCTPCHFPLYKTFPLIVVAQGSNTPSIALRPSRLTTLLTRFDLPLNLGTLSAITYSTLYLLLSPNLAGLSYTPLILGAASLANRLTSTYNRSKVNTVAIAVHVVSWIAQFVGHGKYEGRKPALLDNLVQALFLAPLFVWYEVLFKMGFYKKLQREVEVGIEVEIAKLKGKGKAV